MRRLTNDGARALSQLSWYAPPGEQRACPACGSLIVRHIEPLGLRQPQDHHWKFGFISGCRQCGVLFANPLPTSTDLLRAYSPEGDWGRTRQEEREKPVTRGRLARAFAPIVAELDPLRPPPGAAVIDFGCGLGGMLDTLANVGWQTFGVESATRVAFTRHTELREVPQDGRFDLAILHHVLEHVTEPLAILRQLAGATREGGFLLVSVPNLDALPLHRDLDYCIRSRTHVLAYSTECLRWLLADAGFEIVSAGGGNAGALAPRTARRSVPAGPAVAAASAGPGGGGAVPAGSSGGVGSGADGTSRLIVLARRTSGPLAKPARPLDAALRALTAYRGGGTARPSGARRRSAGPVRLRAALLNLTREKAAGRLRPS
ncbi:MAG: class I SAM-dependent methyltransferase [Vicinamibacterales bacterium]